MNGHREFDPPRQFVVDAVARAIADDVGPLGDLSAALLPHDDRAVADFIPRAPGVLAGVACATETFAQLDPTVRVTWAETDGASIAKGQSIGRLEGPLRSILTGERTALNFLCHLSGIATLTRQFVDRAGDVRVLETRKTLPGLRALEKAAVRAGGGANHRGTLSDMVLIKDNHLVGTTIAAAVGRARELWPGRGIEVECDRADQVEEAVAAGVDIVMLDNMTPDDAAKCVEIVRTSTRPETLVEISGGVSLDTVASYSTTGADLLSTSMITQSAPALDIGLDLGAE
ncbi:MAG TPA: carboxylating nicotinate-nucleotide diphosphorylase [Acidimicrobiia bacterium]|nr:carboxylating nicotinate-nucleotide diphosphorylase [Acidimicrobiia bacterium]